MFTFVDNMISRINKRYLPPELLLRELDNYSFLKRKVLGFSVQSRPIHEIQMGQGKQKIMMWSQMHGNETTTTKALLDLLHWLNEREQEPLLGAFTFYIIPQLNPDGAAAYTRLNGNLVDLNRDAIDLSQPESQILRAAYQRIQPDYALNLHGQRTIYGAGAEGKPATLSFLAPAANPERTVTPARAKAMEAIAAIKSQLENDLPQGIGRYDDQFNPNCVGDAFTQLGTPTLLFEAGHYPEDYQREQVRSFVLEAYKALFRYLLNPSLDSTTKAYFEIPENASNYVDLIVLNVALEVEGKHYQNQQLALQYLEVLEQGEVRFLPTFKAFAKQLPFKAHRYVNLNKDLFDGILSYQQDQFIKNEKLNQLFSLNDSF